MSSDPHWGSVILAMHMDGPNGSSIFVDGKGRVVASRQEGTGTAPLISTNQSRFGGASARFFLGVQPNGGFIETNNEGAFDFGTAVDYTVETWLYPLALSTIVHLAGTLHLRVGYRGGWALQVTNGGAVQLQGSSVITSSNGVIPLNTWSHVAAARQGGVTKLFANGVTVASTAGVIDMPRPTWSYPQTVRMGAFFGDSGVLSNILNGHLDDLRITRGVARYTADFTPPTAPFPDGSKTLSGIIRDHTGAPVARLVRVYDRTTGALAGSTTSSALDGSFSIAPMSPGPCTVIALDDDAGDPYNAVIADRVTLV